MLKIELILIETNKVADMRFVDMFFNAHGYANAATVLNREKWLDNLYMRLPGGPLALPTGFKSWVRKNPSEWSACPDRPVEGMTAGRRLSRNQTASAGS